MFGKAPPSSSPKEVTGGKWGTEKAVPVGTGLVAGDGVWGGGKVLLLSSSVQKEFLWSGVAVQQRLGLHP